MMNDIEILLIRKCIKNINLRIDAQGVVKVSAPMRCPLQTIQSYLLDKQDWITKHAHRRSVPSAPLIENGAKQVFLGQHFPLIIRETDRKPTISFDGHQIACFVKKNATCIEVQALLQGWQRDQMRGLLPNLIAKWEPIIEVKVNHWGIRAMQTRWGSCNPVKKRIWMNLYLIQKPLICLEYVLVHEMVHLLEASHNHRFKAYMTRFMPEWRTYKSWLI